jgi:hypothetical protein
MMSVRWSACSGRGRPEPDEQDEGTSETALLDHELAEAFGP